MPEVKANTASKTAITVIPFRLVMSIIFFPKLTHFVSV